MDRIPTLDARSGESAPLRLDDLLAELGRRAAELRFRVAPNPCVGAAVISQGVEIGRGFHASWGGPHAEVLALEAAATSGVAPQRWDTLVVTLEPCSSQGKTPPCVDALLAAGCAHVVVGAVDPDPRHRGQGLERLRAAGVQVELLPGSAPLSRVAPHFLRWLEPERLRRPRPWTIAKWAQTRTGQLTPPEEVGQGRWISDPSSQREVHELRARVDAIVTGIGTVLADDPRLSVRGTRADRPPRRVVLDTELRLSPDARLFEPDAEGEAAGPVQVFCLPGAAPVRHRALEARGARVSFVRTGDDGRLSLREVARALWDDGVRRILLEAGPTLMHEWFRHGLVDQVAVYTGAVNGGRGPSLAEWLRPRRIEDSLLREVGSDAVLEAFVRPFE